jgi:hypothetical protein
MNLHFHVVGDGKIDETVTELHSHKRMRMMVPFLTKVVGWLYITITCNNSNPAGCCAITTDPPEARRVFSIFSLLASEGMSLSAWLAMD